MKYLPLSVLLLTTPVQAADMSTQACLELIRDYWKTYEADGAEPASLYDKFASQCEVSKELDSLMLSDSDINDTIKRLTEKGILK